MTAKHPTPYHNEFSTRKMALITGAVIFVVIISAFLISRTMMLELTGFPFFEGGQEGGNCTIPQEGLDWNISGSNTCSNQDITLDEFIVTSGSTLIQDSTLEVNTLSVEEGATLTLDNVTIISNTGDISGIMIVTDSRETVWQNSNLTISGTYVLVNSILRMNGTCDGCLGINVTPTGTLLVNQSSVITNGENQNAQYFFVSETGSFFSMNDSSVNETGWRDWYDYEFGLVLKTPSYLRNNSLSGFIPLSLLDGSNSTSVVTSSLTGISSSFYGMYISGTGISGLNISNNTISSINSFGAGGDDYGIYAALLDRSNISYNTFSSIGGSAATQRGVGIFLVGNNNTIKGNRASNIGGMSGNGYGVALWIYGDAIDTANYNYVTSNTFTSNGGQGVSPLGGEGITLEGAHNNHLYSNTLNSNIYYGLYLTGSDNNNITSNTMNSQSGTGSSDGAYISSTSDNNSFEANTLASNQDTGFTVLGSQNTFKNNTVRNNVYGYSFSLSAANNNTIILDNITSNTYGIDLRTARHNKIIDTNISSSTYDIAASFLGASNNTNTILNTTFNHGKTFFSAAPSTGNLTVQWYLDLYVNRTGGSPVPNANVSIYNNSGSLVSTILTDSSGWITRQNLTEYFENRTGKFYETNYTINISAPGYSNTSLTVNLTESKSLVATLSVLSVTVTQVAPVAAYTSNTSNVTFTYNVSSNTSISNCTVYAGLTPSILTNLTNTSTTIQKDTNQTLSLNLSNANYFWKVGCSSPATSTNTSSRTLIVNASGGGGIVGIILTPESPTNTTYTTGDIDYNVTISGATPSVVLVSVDGGANVTLINDTIFHYYHLAGAHSTLGNGVHNITFYVNETGGTKNQSTVYFTVSIPSTPPPPVDGGGGGGGGGSLSGLSVQIITPVFFTLGEDEFLQVRIRNHESSTLSNIRVSVLNCPSGWTCSPTTISSLPPSGTIDVFLPFDIPDTATTGQYQITVKAESAKTGEDTETITLSPACSVSSDCAEGYLCAEGICKRKLEIEIIGIDNPISPGETLDFTYSIETVGATQGDYNIEFSLGNISNTTTITIGDLERITRSASLQIPQSLPLGQYEFTITVTGHGLTLSDSETIVVQNESPLTIGLEIVNINLNPREGSATLSLYVGVNKDDSTPVNLEETIRKDSQIVWQNTRNIDILKSEIVTDHITSLQAGTYEVEIKATSGTSQSSVIKKFTMGSSPIGQLPGQQGSYSLLNMITWGVAALLILSAVIVYYKLVISRRKRKTSLQKSLEEQEKQIKTRFKDSTLAETLRAQEESLKKTPEKPKKQARKKQTSKRKPKKR